MRRRQGFTIVELLVALALIIFIMVILTEAFSAGLDTFRQLKAIGDMQERMRHVAIIMRNDLRSVHFNNATTPPLGPTGLSGVDLRNGGVPPDQGYFRIWQNPNNQGAGQYWPNSIVEGNDADSLPQFIMPDNRNAFPSTRCTDTNAFIAFTIWPQAIAVPATGPQAYLTAALPGGPIDGQLNGNPNPLCPPDFASGPGTLQPNGAAATSAQWGEVAYFLRQLNTTAGGVTPLYALYRRQRLMANLVPSGIQSPPLAGNPPGNWQSYYDFSFPYPVAPAIQTQLNDPSSITIPPNRILMDGVNAWGTPGTFWRIQDFVAANDPRIGDDIMLTDVISFDIKVLEEGYDPTQTPVLGTGQNYSRVSQFIDLPPASASQNTNFGNASVFDTWSNQAPYTHTAGQVTPTNVPLPIRILAIQITLRVWDERTQQARQMTIIQNM
jgi:type II secretory pathway pseudopilin PulG